MQASNETVSSTAVPTSFTWSCSTRQFGDNIVYGFVPEGSAATDGEIFYVGSSGKGLSTPRAKYKQAHNNPGVLGKALVERITSRPRYQIVVLKHCATRAEAYAAECEIITELRTKGVPLLNVNLANRIRSGVNCVTWNRQEETWVVHKRISRNKLVCLGRNKDLQKAIEILEAWKAKQAATEPEPSPVTTTENA